MSSVIGLSLGGVGLLFLLYNANVIYNRTCFYCRIGCVLIPYLCQYISTRCCYNTTNIDIDNTPFLINMLANMAETDVIFVKILQSLAFNENFIDKKVHDQITQFTDNVPYDESDIDHHVIVKMLTSTPFTFSSTPRVPIRSGMISIVYLLEHEKTREKYIMKVKRKNIDNRVNESIDNMMGLLYIISMICKMWFKLDVIDVIMRHLDLLRDQLDYKQEEMNTISAYNDLQDIDYIRIPKVYKCEDLYGRAIIMEYLPGKHMNYVSEHDKAIHRDLILKYFFASSMVHHKFHGDLHSGNILFIDNEEDKTETNKSSKYPRYQIGVIDFGIVMHFPKNVPDTLFYIFEHQKDPKMINNISREYIENFIEPSNMLDILPDNKVNDILTTTNRVVCELFHEGRPLDQSQFYEIFKGINDNLSREFVTKHGVKTNDGLVKLEVAISMCMNLVSHMTEGDPNTYLKRVFDDMFHSDIMFSD
jgi:predicted unusual protein kinase regulating ubiquinone biosynthesis (AarF/ABC1/UbiB family)